MIGVLQFPGTNCDLDAFNVLKKVLKTDARMVFYKETDLSGLDALVIPGGFSYGDHLRAGAIAARMPVLEEVKRMAEEGKPVLGICNGFQILCESGLLPGALTNNESMKFVCRWLHLRVENNKTLFTKMYGKGEKILIPVKHGEGRYTCDDKTLREIKDNNQIVFRYIENPNGSRDDIAGVCNLEGNVLGLMPHPENASEKNLGSDDGLKIFEGIVNFIK